LTDAGPAETLSPGRHHKRAHSVLDRSGAEARCESIRDLGRNLIEAIRSADGQRVIRDAGLEPVAGR